MRWPPSAWNLAGERLAGNRNALARRAIHLRDGCGTRSPAANGVLALSDKDETSRLTGRPDGSSIAGTLTIGAKSWDFTAAQVESPGGDRDQVQRR